MLNQDYKDILSLLLEKEAEFLVVGAYAMAAHGYPRATADIDIFVKPSPENASRVYQAIREFGAPLENIIPADFEAPGTVFQIGVEPRRIDLMTEIDGLSFDEADKDKDVYEIEGIRIPFISKNMLIKNKLATGREKDRLDAVSLKSIP